MKSIKMRGVVAAVTGALLFGFGANAMADSTDDILNALIAKGVLTEEEGALLQKGRTGEKEAAEKKKASDIKASFKDGIKWESGDKANSMSVNGRIQLDYRDHDWGSTEANNVNAADTFDVRRAYLGAKGRFAKYYDWEVTADFSQVSGSSAGYTPLDVAYMNIHWWDQVQFQFGQFKMPFSLEERTSSRFIDFQERSFVNNSSLTPGKERGAMIHGTPFKGFNYALAFSTGQGKNTNEVDTREDSKDTIFHVDANIAEMMDIKNSVIHVGASYANGDLAAAEPGKQKTEGRGVEFFAANEVFGGVSMERTRQGFETAIAYGPVKFQGEYNKTNFDGKTTAGVNYDTDMSAYYAEVLWLVTGENYADSYKKGKFDRIKPKNDFDPEFKNGLGAFEIGARYSNFDASDFKLTNTAGTGKLKANYTNGADSWTLGLKWLPTANSRFLVNYVKTDFDTPVTYAGKTEKSDKTIMLRAQYDF